MFDLMNEDALKEAYSDVEYCRKDLVVARKAITNMKTTRESYEQIQKMLEIMYVHCPNELHHFVYAAIEGAELRKPVFEREWATQE